MDGDNMKKIPLKNYIALGLIFILTVGILIYFVNFYNSKKEYENSTNDRMNFLKEITTSDFNNYITENLDFILYTSNSENQDIVKVEKTLKNKLGKKEYINQMIYLNLKNTSINFMETLKQYFSENLKSTDYKEIPNVLIVQDGLIIQTLYVDINTTALDIIKFIEKNYD